MSVAHVKPVIWLVEEFLEGQADKQSRARAELAALLPKIASLLEKSA